MHIIYIYIYIYIKKVMINITIKTLILFEKQWHIRLTLFKEDLIIKGKSKNKNVRVIIKRRARRAWVGITATCIWPTVKKPTCV